MTLHVQLIGFSTQLNALEGQPISLKIQYAAKLGLSLASGLFGVYLDLHGLKHICKRH
jgi:hypothetical protein